MKATILAVGALNLDIIARGWRRALALRCEEASFSLSR
jgi:hypothetical protein